MDGARVGASGRPRRRVLLSARPDRPRATSSATPRQARKRPLVFRLSSPLPRRKWVELQRRVDAVGRPLPAAANHNNSGLATNWDDELRRLVGDDHRGGANADGGDSEGDGEGADGVDEFQESWCQAHLPGLAAACVVAALVAGSSLSPPSAWLLSAPALVPSVCWEWCLGSVARCVVAMRVAAASAGVLVALMCCLHPSPTLALAPLVVPLAMHVPWDGQWIAWGALAALALVFRLCVASLGASEVVAAVVALVGLCGAMHHRTMEQRRGFETSRALAQRRAQRDEVFRVAHRTRALQLQAETKANENAAGRVKTERMLGYVNHEIRNPLNGLTNLLDFAVTGIHAVIAQHPPTHPQHQTICAVETDLTNARECCQVLHTIVNDVLDIRKLEEGKIALNLRPVRLAALARPPSLDIISRQNAKVKLVFTPVAEEHHDLMVLCDSHRTTQVLSNLVSNALKFTDMGHVCVSLRVEEDVGELVHVRFEVRDTGRGVPERKRHLLFQPYSQVKVSDQSKRGGTGLGLHLCKMIVEELLHGEIRFEPAVPFGSVFYFRLPLRKAPSEGSASFSESDASPDIRQPKGPNLRALVVDDVRLNREVLARVLQAQGHEVVHAKDGCEAVEMCRQPLDVVFMDLQMPNMDGLTAARKIRHDLGLSPTALPIVLVTAGMGEGPPNSDDVNLVLTKPVVPARVKAALAKLCHR